MPAGAPRGGGVRTRGGLAEGEASPNGLTAEALPLYLRLLPPEFLAQVRDKHQLGRQNNRIYTDAVVMWLMIQQRLSEASMESAVLELFRTLPMALWPQPCARLQAVLKNQGTPSSNTASYNQARQELPLAVVRESADHSFLQLIAGFDRAQTAQRAAFIIDGSTMRTPASDELLQPYPPARNQKGPSHWPLLRIVVAHDVYSGLAMRPEWGPANGNHAVSEQRLLERAIDRLPADAVAVGDANFGVFSVAYAATVRQHPVLLRLTMSRAAALAKAAKVVLRDGMDLRMRWKPSPHDRRSHPELPADAEVEGRMIVRQVQPRKGAQPFLLVVFTTLEDDADSVIELYGRRWNIETDLRSLKTTLRLHQLTTTTPAMVGKEIDLAMMAYNLVRAVIGVAAQKAGLEPRRFSFTRVLHVINAFVPTITAASNKREGQKRFDTMMYYVSQAKLPRRRKKRPSYPRAVWAQPQTYPKRKK
jgi:hypothetical protein